MLRSKALPVAIALSLSACAAEPPPRTPLPAFRVDITASQVAAEHARNAFSVREWIAKALESSPMERGDPVPARFSAVAKAEHLEGGPAAGVAVVLTLQVGNQWYRGEGVADSNMGRGGHSDEAFHQAVLIAARRARIAVVPMEHPPAMAVGQAEAAR